MNDIDFYFDFISPFSYLAHVKLPDLAKHYGAKINYRPMNIPGAKMAAGNYGPSNRDIPAKIKIIVPDIERWARRYGVPLKFPKSFEGEKWNIGVLFAEQNNRTEAFVTVAYERLWGQGVDPSEDNELRAAATAAGLDPDAMMAYVDSSLGQTEFRKSCTDAHAQGIFGAPIMVVGDQYFWGNDRLDFLEEHLQSLAS